MKAFMNLDRARAELQARELDAILITSTPGLWYATGLPAWYTAGNNLAFILEKLAPVAVVLGADGQRRFIAPQSLYEFAQQHVDFDGFYGTRSSMHMERAYAVPVVAGQFLDAVAQALQDAGARRVAVEARYLSIEWYDGLRRLLPEVTFTREGEVILQDLKLIKSEREITLLRRATDLNVHAMAASLDALRAGVTERELQRIVKTVLLAGGGCWNQTTVGAGGNGAVPYNIPGDRVLRDGDLVRYDIGGTLDGYSSDLARVAAVGKVNPESVRLYETLQAGLESTLAMIRPGVTFAEIFHHAMGHVWNNGCPDFRRGNVGHTIGIELEEEPFIGPNDHRPLAPNMVLAVELPWYSVQHGFGLNVEDIVLVTETGCEILSAQLPRGLYMR